MPGLQAVQALAPVPVKYLPAAHGAHSVPPAVLAYVPSMQALHTAELDAPVAVAKVPTGQF